MFRLHKWYFDCVTSAGDVLIVHVATLRWGLVRLGYTALLGRIDGSPVAATRLGRAAVPELAADGIAFADPRLPVHGQWRGVRCPRPHTLWSSSRGAVQWHCHLPLATVELTALGHTLRGTGYAEHLALDVAPWHLPIEELRWGRFHGGGRSLVWIQWQGPVPLRLCLRDGALVEVGPIGDDGFALGSGERLALGAPAVLRDGALGRTVLAQRLLRWLPVGRSVRAMRETKWFAAGRLGADAPGTAVHEVVRWT